MKTFNVLEFINWLEEEKGMTIDDFHNLLPAVKIVLVNEYKRKIRF